MQLGNAELALSQHPGIAIFVATGDGGYSTNNPEYPATSAHAIAVGGTVLAQASGTKRGWAETAWNRSGSWCSQGIAALYTTPCTRRASADISAVTSPGVAVYDGYRGGWLQVSSTGGAAPLVAGMFALTQHGAESATYVQQHSSALNDVTSGSNGTCANAECNAGSGWDGPTGWGTPTPEFFGIISPATISVSSPHAGDRVKPGFDVLADASDTNHVELLIDGVAVATQTAAPFTFHTPKTLVNGNHTIEVVASKSGAPDSNSTLGVVVDDGTGSGSGSDQPPPEPQRQMGGCSTGTTSGLAMLLVVGFACLRRSRRTR
jgi:hypothetical protein